MPLIFIVLTWLEVKNILVNPDCSDLINKTGTQIRTCAIKINNTLINN